MRSIKFLFSCVRSNNLLWQVKHETKQLFFFSPWDRWFLHFFITTLMNESNSYFSLFQECVSFLSFIIINTHVWAFYFAFFASFNFNWSFLQVSFWNIALVVIFRLCNLGLLIFQRYLTNNNSRFFMKLSFIYICAIY